VAWLLRRYKESGLSQDQRFATAVRWLLVPHMKKGAQLALDQVYPTLKVEQSEEEIDPGRSFAVTSAMLGAH